MREFSSADFPYESRYVDVEGARLHYVEQGLGKPLWRWPHLLPIAGDPRDVVRAVEEYNAKLQSSNVLKLLLHVEPGALMRKPMVEWCGSHLPNLETADLGRGIHFVQEDHLHSIGRAVSAWYAKLG